MHVAPDWADIYDAATKQEKTYLKPFVYRFQETCLSTRKP